MLGSNAVKIAAIVTMLFGFLTLSHADDYTPPPVTDKRPALPLKRTSTLWSQCGPVNDLQDVELYDGLLGVSKDYVKLHEPTTAQFQWLDESAIRTALPNHSPGNIAGERWCTGTLITDRYVLTAGHCFDIQNDPGGWTTPFMNGPNGKPEFAPPKTLATLQNVNFKYQINGATRILRTPDVFPIIRLIEHRGPRTNLDYAIVELGPNKQGQLPGKIYSPASISTRVPLQNESVAIIQHPQGEPKKIEAGKILRVEDFRTYYNDIDTHGGSSGSGVRDKEGVIIAVHTNGGCESDANQGVSNNSIAKESDILKRLNTMANR